MFTIKANPTFPACLTIIGQGKEQQLNVTFRHMKLSEYQSMLDSIRNGESSSVDAVQKLVQDWDADAEVSRESISDLVENQPGADWAIITGFRDAFTVSRKGN